MLANSPERYHAAANFKKTRNTQEEPGAIARAMDEMIDSSTANEITIAKSVSIITSAYRAHPGTKCHTAGSGWMKVDL